MARVIWDNRGERFYETGIDQGMIYLQNAAGIYDYGEAWSGLTSVSENPTGADANPIYADNIKYLNLIGIEEYEGSIGAYWYPPAFAQCNGEEELVPGVLISQQSRKTFGLCYRTRIGNDVDLDSHGYKLHLVYGATATPSERSYETVNDSPEPAEMSWDFTTTPPNVEGHKPVAHLEIDSTKVNAENLAMLENILYGDSANDPRLPLPLEVAQILGGSLPTAVLSALTIAGATLSPAFDASKTEYTTTVSSASAAVTATAAEGAVAILVNNESIASGDTASFEEGANTVAVTVRNGAAVRTYTVAVTYTA